MRWRLLLFTTVPTFVLICAFATAPLPDQESLPNDSSKVGQRTTRKDQAPRPFREYPGIEYENFPLPPDAAEKSRVDFRPVHVSSRSRMESMRMPNWTIDYPRSDRHLSAAVRGSRVYRRDRSSSRSRPRTATISITSHGCMRVEVGHWDLTDLQAAKLRDYLLRGGFFMCDDFHGTREWEIFVRKHEEGLSRPADRRDPGQRSDLPYRLRSGRPLPGTGRTIRVYSPDVRKGRI